MHMLVLTPARHTPTNRSSKVVTTINTQLPYAYAHMVSLIVHLYLVVLATWLGFFLSSGFPTTGYHTTNSPDGSGTSRILRTVYPPQMQSIRLVSMVFPERFVHSSSL